MRLGDYLGDLQVSAEQAKAFIGSWFRADDLVVLPAVRTERRGKYDVITQTMTAQELYDSLDDETLRSLSILEDGSLYNLYINVAPVNRVLGLQERGTVKEVARIPGVWVDFDVKPGCFDSREQILEFISEKVPLRPTILVGSGSGGIHAYWKVDDYPTLDKKMLEQWWGYIAELAEGHSIDKLLDTARMLRLAGAIYFPKKGSGSPTAMNVLIEANTNSYTTQQIFELAKGSYERQVEKRKALIARDKEIQFNVSMATYIRGNKWKKAMAAANMEDWVNENMSWFEILEPYGWTHLRVLNDGSNEWARPGRNERSAVCDFEGSPVMSLLSTSEDTDLSDLLDAHIPLTKFRVLLRLKYDDNEMAMVDDLIDIVNGG